MWGHMLPIPALRRLRQEDLKFEGSQGNMARLCLKNKTNQTNKQKVILMSAGPIKTKHKTLRGIKGDLNKKTNTFFFGRKTRTCKCAKFSLE
jgi:hypothetical protein